MDLQHTDYFRIPLPSRLRRLEISSGVGVRRVVLQIIRTAATSLSTRYSSTFQVTVRDEDLISTEAMFAVEGRIGQTFAINQVVQCK